MSSVTRRWIPGVIVSCLSFVLGCASPWHDAMEGFTTPRSQLFAQRIGEALDQQRNVREILQDASAELRRLSQADASRRTERVDLIGTLGEQASWLAWDASKSVASVRDVASMYFEDWEADLPPSDDGPDQAPAEYLATRQRSDEMCAALEQADASMLATIETLDRELQGLRFSDGPLSAAEIDAAHSAVAIALDQYATDSRTAERIAIDLLKRLPR